MHCSPRSIFADLDMAFMYSKTIPEINSRTNIMFKAVLKGYQIDNFNNTPCIISSMGDTAC